MSRYNISCDWISIVVPLPVMGEGSSIEQMQRVLWQRLRARFGEMHSEMLFSKIKTLDYGRAPYTFGWADAEKGLSIWASEKMPHATVEFSGQGIAWLRGNASPYDVVLAQYEAFSRFDLAVDIETDWSPEMYVALREKKAQLTSAVLKSPAGETCYIGSRHSERYARVYRYAPPHPRSHLLRIEFVFKRAYAKRVGNLWFNQPPEAVLKGALLDFGWGMVANNFGELEPADLSIYRPERNQGKTVRWLVTQVAASFHRLVKEKVIPNPREFVERYFLIDPETGEAYD